MKNHSVKKESWLTEIRADREEWVELLGSTPSDATLRHLGISRRTWSGIAGGRCPRVPMAAYRLASFQRHGACLRELGQLRRELAMLRRELDWVEVSPAVAGWLRRLGMRPAVL